MKALSFKGGIYPHHNKESTEGMPVEVLPGPERVVIPLHQHLGAPCKPVVEAGDRVKKGQLLGEAQGYISANIHASLSGEVEMVGPYNHPAGSPVEAVIIASDGQEEWHPEVVPVGELEEITPEEIRRAVWSAGIVGMGGAAFPGHVKLETPQDKPPVDTVIINGAECEPYLTGDHRLMLERPKDVLYGLKLMMKALRAEAGIIGIEENKPDAMEVMVKTVEGEENIRVASLHTKYPQGAEKMLIYSITRREVPSGGLPLDVGVINHNVGTAVAVTEAVRQGKPLVERVVTYTGPGVKNPGNLKLRVGTLLKDVIRERNGLREETSRVIMGGPMMGLAQTNDNVPVLKGTGGILALTREELGSPAAEADCIKCGRCVDVCPVQLAATLIAHSYKYGLTDRAERYHAMDCIECGSCSFICPAGIPLTKLIREAKGKITEKRKAEQG